MIYDLEERTAKFGENIIKLCQTVQITEITKSIVNQLIRAATSIGANYMEANQSSSNKDFRNKIKIAQKEANESKHWLRMLAIAYQVKIQECRVLWKEAHELTLILASISRKCQAK